MSDQKTNDTTYWKSLNELAKNKEYQKYAEREFPEDASELTDQVSRRSFLRVMGASIALAGFASCRKPMQKILPYSKQPEDQILGVPNFYATSMPFQDTVAGLLIENSEGRPSKVEGNERHPSSLGKTSIYHQASILGMYDPDRSRQPQRNGEKVTYDDFAQFAASHFAQTNRNILFISEGSSSPTLHRLKGDIQERFPNSQWVTHEPFNDENRVEGTNLTFGQRLRTVNHFDKAGLVVSFDDDFMSPSGNKNSVEAAREFSMARNVNSVEDTMSRLYSIENNYSTTGSMADHRLRLKSSEIEAMVYALASRLSQDLSGLNAYSGYTNELSGHEMIETLAGDLIANRSNSILTAGTGHSPAVHATISALNSALGNIGSTVTVHELPFQDDVNNSTAFSEAIAQAESGSFDTVVILGANPVFTAPADLQFENALSNIETKIHLSDYVDETSQVCDWHVNKAHFMEAWGDGHAYTGERSIIQPQIAPLFDGVSDIELLHTLLTGEAGSGYDLVRETWQSVFSGNFEQEWERTLHDGIDSSSTGFPSVSASIQSGFSSQISPMLQTGISDGIELTIKPDPTLFDGRYANNGWLQELPDPMTKITWDNVALMSPSTAESLGIPKERSFSSDDVPVVRIETGNGAIEIAAWIQPGHADNSITLYAGYGRNKIGRVADGVGVDIYPLRTTESSYFLTADVSATGQMFEIACVQDHNSIEGRDMVREATLDEYRENPNFSSYESVHGYEVPGIEEAEHEGDSKGPISLFDEQYGPDYQPQWGMAIDLNTCFGCGVCTIACQAENNIPVVGKREVSRRRIMHWIRTDRYYEGDEDNPGVYHQPVPCMHCELAPCEQVCPVAATVHSEDGMNQMTYNRCIGTRYCANNCPFKVRRFNFFHYSEEYLTTGDDPEIIQMAMNPEVTIRFRGVMEKCSYCVQRVNRAKIETRKETGSRKPADGTVKTACQQACPADAISFGDLTDRESVVSQHKMNERNYVMLEEINVRPRTSYLAKLRNPNPELS
jgi:molybdopterin-containing oxidoreductase family iron-sulfur binding subunit